MKDVYIVSAKRTPVGKAYKGAFKATRPDDLLVHVLRVMREAYPSIEGTEIADVIIGCAMPEAEQGMNVARIATLLAGFPVSVPGMTVNRFCASGVQAVALGAQMIALGQADCVLTGGVESMSMVPMGGNKLSYNPDIFAREESLSIAYGMGITAEKVAQRWGITRSAQDEFAYVSHQKAVEAAASGYFLSEMIPMWVDSRVPNLSTQCIDMNSKQITLDEGPRSDTTVDKLASLKPVFKRQGTVTAGNSSQMSDGAGVVMLASEAMLKRHNLTPMAQFRGYAVAGVDPAYMGIGPVEAIPKVLAQTGIALQDIDWIELNEAFAAQSLAVINELALDPSRVNPQGGAIALGHPLGATGAIRTATLVHGLCRTQARYGMVTMCIGTGMGAAAVYERV